MVTLKLSELIELNITEVNKNSYDSVIVEWQDTDEAKIKSIKAGRGEMSYKMRIAKPKSEAEAYRMGEAKLNALNKGGISGSLRTAGGEIRAADKLEIVFGDDNKEIFDIKRVVHTLDGGGYFVDIEFER